MYAVFVFVLVSICSSICVDCSVLNKRDVTEENGSTDNSQFTTPSYGNDHTNYRVDEHSGNRGTSRYYGTTPNYRSPNERTEYYYGTTPSYGYRTSGYTDQYGTRRYYGTTRDYRYRTGSYYGTTPYYGYRTSGHYGTTPYYGYRTGGYYGTTPYYGYRTGGYYRTTPSYRRSSDYRQDGITPSYDSTERFYDSESGESKYIFPPKFIARAAYNAIQSTMRFLGSLVSSN